MDDRKITPIGTPVLQASDVIKVASRACEVRVPGPDCGSLLSDSEPARPRFALAVFHWEHREVLSETSSVFREDCVVRRDSKNFFARCGESRYHAR